MNLVAECDPGAPPAVVLVSGGLDSATVMAMAMAEGFACYALSFNYGQRHAAELQAAARLVAANQAALHRVVDIDLRQLGGSALTDSGIEVPTLAAGTAAGTATGTNPEPGIPVTYVPARNTVFLSFALAWAEVLGARDIFIGVNAVDYSGYPDCRPEFIAAFEQMANLATKIGVEGEKISIHTPLVHLPKSEIILQGLSLGVDYALTVSCYQADASGRACGVCESCHIRRQGFLAAGVADPTRYFA